MGFLIKSNTSKHSLQWLGAVISSARISSHTETVKLYDLKERITDWMCKRETLDLMKLKNSEKW